MLAPCSWYESFCEKWASKHSVHLLTSLKAALLKSRLNPGCDNFQTANDVSVGMLSTTKHHGPYSYHCPAAQLVPRCKASCKNSLSKRSSVSPNGLLKALTPNISRTWPMFLRPSTNQHWEIDEQDMSLKGETNLTVLEHQKVSKVTFDASTPHVMGTRSAHPPSRRGPGESKPRQSPKSSSTCRNVHGYPKSSENMWKPHVPPVVSHRCSPFLQRSGAGFGPSSAPSFVRISTSSTWSAEHPEHRGPEATNFSWQFWRARSE